MQRLRGDVLGGRRRALLAGIAATLAACGARHPAQGTVDPVGPAGSVAAYIAPPTPIGAEPLRDGALRIIGRAPANALVVLNSPQGEALETRADAHGAWRVRLAGGGAGAPALYAISAQLGDRRVRAEGALVTTPGALAPAVMVRAGDAAEPLLVRTAAAIATVDYDPGGAVAVSGFDPPGAPVSLLVDGAPAAAGHADAQGRYALVSANHRLSFAPHTLEVRTPSGAVERQVTLTPPETLSSPYRATPLAGGGWRVEWALTGGGQQTTLVLGP